MTDQAKPKGNSPIIYAVTDKDSKVKNGLDLWPNLPKEPGAELPKNAPEMTGMAWVDNEKFPVSAWVKEGAKEGDPPFISIAPRGKDAQGNFQKGTYGTAKAANQVVRSGTLVDLPPTATPYIVGDLTINNKKKELRGFISESGLDFMFDLGFSEQVIANAQSMFESKRLAKESQ